MATGLYTPLQLIAAQGMLSNVGISLPTNLTNAVTSYNSIPAIEALLDTIALAPTYGLSGAVITQIKTLGANSCPALGDSVPTAYANTVTPVQTVATIPTTTDAGFVQFVEDTGNKYLGDGDLTKFVSVFSSVTGYQSLSAQFVYSAVNANKLGTTFTSMNDLITGDITKVTLALPAFAEDLAKIGKAIDLSKLEQLGTPAGLLQQISISANIVRGTLPSLEQALLKQGVTSAEIVRLCTPSQSTLELTRTQFNSLQKRAYDALGTITGTDLTEILDILDTTIAGTTNLQDLLNPARLFGASWPSLTVATPTGIELIYQPDGSINSNIRPFVDSLSFGANDTVTGCDELAKIVPPTQAQASVALAVSLGQINNITGTTTEQLAKALTDSVQTLKGLDQIESLTAPLPASVNTYIQNNVATGSGPFGVLTVTDFLGISSGTLVVDWLNQVVSGTSAMDLTALKAVYDNMLNCVQGDYGPAAGPINIPSGPGTGAYANADDAFTTGLIPAAVTEITSLISTYPSITSSLNQNFTAICQRIVSEANNQSKAGINYDDFVTGTISSIYSFVGGLSTVGAYNTPGGQAQYLIQVADVSTLAGQAIVGAIREGNNQTALNEAGIPLDSFGVSPNYPGNPTGTGSPSVVVAGSLPTGTVSNLNEPAAAPAPVQYQPASNPLSTSYTVSEAKNSTASTTGTAAPSVVKIDQIYLQKTGTQAPGDVTTTVLQDTAFWIKLIVYPSDANTQVTLTTVSGFYVTTPGVTLNSGEGVLIQVPGWLIPAVGPSTLVASAGQPGGATKADSTTLNVAANYYPSTATVVQDGWFTSVNETVYGNEVTVILRGPPSQMFIWGTNWTTTWPVGSDTFDSDGYAVYSGLTSPPISDDNQITVRYSTGEIIATSFKTNPA